MKEKSTKNYLVLGYTAEMLQCTTKKVGSSYSLGSNAVDESF